MKITHLLFLLISNCLSLSLTHSLLDKQRRLKSKIQGKQSNHKNSDIEELPTIQEEQEGEDQDGQEKQKKQKNNYEATTNLPIISKEKMLYCNTERNCNAVDFIKFITKSLIEKITFDNNESTNSYKAL